MIHLLHGSINLKSLIIWYYYIFLLFGLLDSGIYNKHD